MQPGGAFRPAGRPAQPGARRQRIRRRPGCFGDRSALHPAPGAGTSRPGEPDRFACAGNDHPSTRQRNLRPHPACQLDPARQPDAGCHPDPSTRTPTLGPDGWKKLPIIPVVSDRVLEIYRRGQELGNNPRSFSKIGDCGSTPAWFLGDFDRGPSYYGLGEYQNLAEVIEQFHGSFDRTSLAARAGFNASALFVPIWADRSSCEADEGPLTCEYRVNRPVIAFIMLGTNDVYHPEEFEPQMRKIIEYSIEQGVIPILTTKADNKEEDGSINATIARLALEYQVPLWNFYAAVDPLSNNGLQEDMAHLTWGRNLFDDPDAMSKAWPHRNLRGLGAGRVDSQQLCANHAATAGHAGVASDCRASGDAGVPVAVPVRRLRIVARGATVVSGT